MKKDFSKSDLKTGMIIVDSEDVVRLWLSSTAISYNDGGISEDMISDNLITDLTSGEISFDKIYSEPNASLNADFNFWFKQKYIIEHCKLLWERKPEKTINLPAGDYSITSLESIIEKNK